MKRSIQLSFLLTSAMIFNPVKDFLQDLWEGMKVLLITVYCEDDELTDPVSAACPVNEKGRFIGVAFVKQGFNFVDPTSTAEWQAGIAAGDIKILNYTRGSYGGGEETTSEGFGLQLETTTGQTHEAVYSHRGVEANYEFYNLLRISTQWKAAFVTSSGKLHIVAVPVNWKPKQIVPAELEGEETYEVTVSWSDVNDPVVTEAPTGIFAEIN